MPLSDKALDDLRAIYRREFQREITRDEASEIGTRVINLLRLLLQPLPSENKPPGHRPEL